MYFWTVDQTEIDHYKKEIGITWDDLPTLVAKCGADGYVYPKEYPLVIASLKRWLDVMAEKVNGQIEDVPAEFKGVKSGVD